MNDLSCKAIVPYVEKQMSHSFIKGTSQHPTRGDIQFLHTSFVERNVSDSPATTSSNFSEDVGLKSPSLCDQTSLLTSSDETNLGNSIFYDDPDSVYVSSLTPDPVLTQKAIEKIRVKIESTKEKIAKEQMIKEENVNEFLKLCAHADRQQHTRMKQLFEKKNQKSAQIISQLQRKLEDYERRQKELEDYGVHPKPSRKVIEKVQGLKNVGGNIISKPKQFAHRLRHRFGSADDLTTLQEKEIIKESRNPLGSSSLPRDNLGAHGPTLYAIENQLSFDEEERSVRSSRQRSTVASEKSDATSESIPLGTTTTSQAQSTMNKNASTEFNTIMQELSLHKDEMERLRDELEETRLLFKLELDAIKLLVREEHDRNDRLEEQLNDLTELHQHEVENIKSGVRDMEEKVQYQSQERLMDIKEHLQGLEAKVNSLEHQQAQQQYINLEGLENSDARAIFLKLLNAVITVVHFSLFILGTCLSLTKPFLQTKSRMVVTFVALVIALVVYNQIDTVQEFVEPYFDAKTFKINFEKGL